MALASLSSLLLNYSFQMDIEVQLTCLKAYSLTETQTVKMISS